MPHLGAAIGIEFCDTPKELALAESDQSLGNPSYAGSWVGVTIRDRATPEEVASGLEQLAEAIRRRAHFVRGQDCRAGNEINSTERTDQDKRFPI